MSLYHRRAGDHPPGHCRLSARSGGPPGPGGQALPRRQDLSGGHRKSRLADGRLRRPSAGGPAGGRRGGDEARPQQGPHPEVYVFEGGHPVPDEDSFRGTQAAVDLVKDLGPEDTVVFLISGGGSALFEAASGAAGGARRPDGGASGLRGRHRGDEHRPQAALRREGRAVRPAVRPRPGVRGGPVGHPGRPAGHDRLRPGGAGWVHLRPGKGGGGEVPSPSLPPSPRPCWSRRPPRPWTMWRA